MTTEKMGTKNNDNIQLNIRHNNAQKWKLKKRKQHTTNTTTAKTTNVRDKGGNWKLKKCKQNTTKTTNSLLSVTEREIWNLKTRKQQIH